MVSLTFVNGGWNKTKSEWKKEGIKMAEKRSKQTIKRAHEWNDGAIGIQHHYQNVEIVEINGVMRVVKLSNKEVAKARLDNEIRKGRLSHDI